MIRHWREIFLGIFTTLLASLFWALSMMPTSDSSPLDYPWLFNRSSLLHELYRGIDQNKFGIGLSAVMLQGIASFVFQVRGNPGRRCLEKILETVIKSELKQDIENTRATVFIVRRGFVIFPRQFYLYFLRYGAAHWRKRIFWFYVFNLPRPWRKYFVIAARRGFPHDEGSSTCFLVPREEKEADGIVALAWIKERPVKVSLPRINKDTINRARKIDEIASEIDRANVEIYMERGRIHNFLKLKTLHRFSEGLWATPLKGRDNELSGVLVFDFNRLEGINFNKIDTKLVRTSVNIEHVLGTLY